MSSPYKGITIVLVFILLYGCSSLRPDSRSSKPVLLSRINGVLLEPLFSKEVNQKIFDLGDCRYLIESHWSSDISVIKGYLDVKTRVTITVPEEYIKTEVRGAYTKRNDENGSTEHWSDGIHIHIDPTVVGIFMTRVNGTSDVSTEEYFPELISIGFSDRLNMGRVNSLAADIDELFTSCGVLEKRT